MRKLILPVLASVFLMAPVVAGSSNVLAGDVGVRVGPLGVGVEDRDRDRDHWRPHHDHDTVIIKKRHRYRDFDHD